MLRIRKLTDYGIFVDLGGIDGLVHVTDISWNRINHPSNVLEIGSKLGIPMPYTNAIYSCLKLLTK